VQVKTGFCLISRRAFRSLAYSILATAVALEASQALAHDEEVIVVGRSAAAELKVDSDFAQPVELPVSIFPGISGYATGELAFHSTVLDDPTNDFFQLSTATDFRFVLLAKDAGMEVWNDTGTGFMGTNDTYFMGPAPFDNHPVWNLVTGTPGHGYSLTLKLRDLNGVYPDSAPFVLSFTPVQIRYPISIAPIDSHRATLLWSTNAVSWELQSAGSVTATNWVTVTNMPGTVGTNFALNIVSAAAQQFFRLRKP
jgi:hypothetical protein